MRENFQVRGNFRGSFSLSGSTPTSSGASSVLTTKGDIVGYDTARKRIGVGSNDQVLTADSTDANGIAWKTPSSSEAHSFTSVETFTPSTQTGITKITVDATDVTNGGVDVVVDGVTKETLDKNTGISTRIYNPSSSLSINSKNVTFDLPNSVYTAFHGRIQNGVPQGFWVSPDGIHAIQGESGYGNVSAYTLSTPHDITTLSNDSGIGHSTSGSFINYNLFSDDGSKFYGRYASNSNWRQMSLSTNWDLTTATNDNITFSVGTNCYGLFFKPDGLKFYISADNTLKQYSCSTAWDLSTASYDSKQVSLTASTNMYQCQLNSDGTKMYSAGDDNRFHQYSLSTAYDISTATYDNIKTNVLSGSMSLGSWLTQDGKQIAIFKYQSGCRWYEHTIGFDYAGTALATVG